MIRRRRRVFTAAQDGMSLVELLIGMTVLVIGVLGSAVLLAIAITTNGRNQQQSHSTAIAQIVAEKIASVPASTSPDLTVTDCNSTNQVVRTSAGGATLLGSGDVDFTQAQGSAGAPANYYMSYTACGPNGRTVVYDVRWNVQSSSGFTKVVTVSAKIKNGSALFSLPVTIRTITGQGS